MKNKFLLLAFLLTGCMTQRKAVKYMNAHGNEAASYCATAFPVKDSTVYIPGRVITTSHTDTIPGPIIPCPEQQPGQPALSVQCPPSINKSDTVTQHDTAWLYRKNTAETAALQTKLDKQSVTLQNAETGRSNWRKWCLWTWGVILIGGGLYLFVKNKISFLTGLISKIKLWQKN